MSNFVRYCKDEFFLVSSVLHSFHECIEQARCSSDYLEGKKRMTENSEAAPKMHPAHAYISLSRATSYQGKLSISLSDDHRRVRISHLLDNRRSSITHVATAFFLSLFHIYSRSFGMELSLSPGVFFTSSRVRGRGKKGHKRISIVASAGDSQVHRKISYSSSSSCIYSIYIYKRRPIKERR